jgi:beta-aspartyl-peptidase (threonine type)
MLKNFSIIILLFIFLISCNTLDPSKNNSSEKFGLVIHGGAGNIEHKNFTSKEIDNYTNKLTEALNKGYSVLTKGGSAVDAVESVIIILEDSPLFNAGRGAVFTSSGINELDAAIMDGSNINAGTVAGIKKVKNPIKLARAIMENSKHVMMIGKGAEQFANEQHLEIVDMKYFRTEKRWESLQRAKEKEKKVNESYLNKSYDNKFGTVGCVALDKKGNLAAGTSTGGMTNKRYGRVGDVPIIGAGTYANNNTAALSATGHGEFFIRNVVTHDISSLMEYKNLTLNEAAQKVIMEKLVKQNGGGGVIGIDKFGNITMTFNTTGMFRGYKMSDGSLDVKIFKE